MILHALILVVSIGYSRGAVVDRRQATTTTTQSSEVPDYFDTTIGWFAGRHTEFRSIQVRFNQFLGPTQTGDAPLLAQTNGAPFPGVSYIPNSPLETQAPIAGNIHNANIFQLLGNLSPYFPNPRGFGVNEYSLPLGSNVSWVNMISRHGSRYPTVSSGPQSLGQKVYNATGKFNATGALSFLNTWKYRLGAEILVPIGKQEYVLPP